MKKKTARRKNFEIKNNSDFSKVNFPSVSRIKKLRKMFKNESDEFFEQHIKKSILKAAEECGYDEDYLQLIPREMEMVNLVLNKKYLNYYIEDENLFNFFINTQVKDSTLVDIKKIINESDNYFIEHEKNIEVIQADNSGKFSFGEGVKRAVGIIHSRNTERSIFFNIFSTEHDLSFYCNNGDDQSVLPLSRIENNCILHKNDIYGEMLRLAINFVFYMSAFPENVIDAPPYEVKDKLNISNSKTISLSKEISDYLQENRDITPHLRRGHFKYLSSEYYTKKRGQTIFVKPTFVKGNAKTVISCDK